jgi:hypothetical protein
LKTILEIYTEAKEYKGFINRLLRKPYAARVSRW